MFLHTFYTPGLAIYSYLVGDKKTKRAVIVDPTRDIESYIKFAQNEGLEITDIAETHVHADFVSGSKELKQRLQGKPIIHCSALGGEKWIPKYADKHVMNGYEINLGCVRLQAVHTPGHTPEHIIWLCYDQMRSNQTPCLALTGDLLFVGSVGRPDLLGKEETAKLTQQLYHSLFDILCSLPDFLEIHPAHGAGSLCGNGLSARPNSTLGYERLYNPFLLKQPIEKWREKLESNMPAAPANFQRLKRVNLQGPTMKSEKQSLANQPQLFIDVRDPELFAKAHIAGSVNVPFGSSFCNWVGSVISQDTHFGLVVGNSEHLDDIVNKLHLIGFDHITHKLVWDESDLKTQFPIETLPLIEVETLAEKLQHQKPPPYVLDVRTPGEWQGGHIPSAHHLELAIVCENISQIPKEANVCVICGSGYRASIIASLLKRNGYPHVANVRGGMNAWHKAKLAID